MRVLSSNRRRRLPPSGVRERSVCRVRRHGRPRPSSRQPFRLRVKTDKSGEPRLHLTDAEGKDVLSGEGGFTEDEDARYVLAACNSFNAVCPPVTFCLGRREQAYKLLNDIEWALRVASGSSKAEAIVVTDERGQRIEIEFNFSSPQ